ARESQAAACMRLWLLTFAAMLVRSWTRAYTRGMDAATRRRRCAEIESDIWESLHDLETTGFHMLVRFARGMPADVLWRLEHALQGGEHMWRKYALIGLAAAPLTTIAWSLLHPSW